MAETQTPFDPWDWLGVHCGGYFQDVDTAIISMLQTLQREGDLHDSYFYCEPPTHIEYRLLICTLLCNADAFEFDDDPTQLRWVGDDRFQTLDQLIEAWDAWYRERYL